MDQESREAALELAVDACADAGGQRTICRETAAVFERCEAIVTGYGDIHGCVVRSRSGPSRKAAEGAAIAACEDVTANCKVVASDCNSNL